MGFPEAMMDENVWFDKPKYEEAEERYQLFLTNNLSAHLSAKHSDQTDGISKVISNAGSALANEIAKARESIKNTLAGMSSPMVSGSSDSAVTALQCENKELRKLVEKLSEQVSALTVRVSKLEGGSSGADQSGKVNTTPAKKDDDDDFDLFGDDDEEEEETEEEKKVREERLKKYNDKKAGKAKVIAKSSVLFDVKPWDDETDMVEVEKQVRNIHMDGLLWGAAKLVPLAYGIKKLQIVTTIEDDKVSTEELTEKIEAFEDYVQSVDIAAFNKI